MRTRELNVVLQLLRGFEHSYHLRFPQYPWEDAYHAGQCMGNWISYQIEDIKKQLFETQKVIGYLQSENQILNSRKIELEAIHFDWGAKTQKAEDEKKEIEKKYSNTIDKLESDNIAKSGKIRLLQAENEELEIEILELETLTTKQHIELVRLRGDSSLP